MKELNEIKYKFVIDTTKFFVGKYIDGEIKDFNQIVNNVKSLCSFVKEMTFIYDESIWPPNKPNTHNNLIQFNVQFINEIGHLPFRFLVKKGIEQDVILLNTNDTKD